MAFRSGRPRGGAGVGRGSSPERGRPAARRGGGAIGTAGRSGSSTRKAAPSPRRDSTRTEPPWASRIRFTM